MDVGVRVLELQVQELGDDGVGAVVVHLPEQEDDPVLEESAVDVVDPLLAAAPLAAAERLDILVADFEGDTYGEGWKTTGTAFGKGPAKGTLPNQMPVSGYLGKGLPAGTRLSMRFTYDNSKTFSSVTGRLGVQYAVNNDVNLYATYNRGAKSGGFFGGQTADVRDLEPFADEKLNAYEIGAKTEWLQHRLRANASAFYYDYKDLQVYTFVVRDGLTVQTLKNASNAHIYGADFELQALPTDRLDLSLALELLHARYIDFVSAQGDYSGNTLPAAPSASISAAARFELPGEVAGGHFSAYLDARYRSHIFFETRNIDRLSDPGNVPAVRVLPERPLAPRRRNVRDRINSPANAL